MTREEPPHQHLLEEFRDAFNVEGLAETRLTCEAKDRILEAAVEKAKWCIGSGCCSQNSISFEQSVLGIRELITHNTDDPRYINFPPWALNVSRSFFGKICGIVEHNLQPDTATRLQPQRVTMPHTLLSIPTPDELPSLVTRNSKQNLPSLLQRTSGKPAVVPTECLHPTPPKESVVAINRKRKRTKETISEKDKGKRRALREEHAQNNTRVSLDFNVEKNMLKGYHVGMPSVERGGAEPSDWAGRGGVRQQREPVPLDGVLAPPPFPQSGLALSELVIDGRSNSEVTSLDQNYRQFLENIMKAHQIALMPSERVRLNLCISLASHMNDIPVIPLIGSAPILQSDSSSNASSPNSQLVHDCQNGLLSASHRSVSGIRNYSLCPLVDIARPLEGERDKPKMTRTHGGNDSRGNVSVPPNVTQEVQSPKAQVNSDFDAKVLESVVSEITLNHPVTQPACGRLELSGTSSHRLFVAKDVTMGLRTQSASEYIQAPGIQTNPNVTGELLLQLRSKDDSKAHCEHEKQAILSPSIAMGSRDYGSPVPLMYLPHLSIPQGTSFSVVSSANPVPATWVRTGSHRSYVPEAALTRMELMTCGPSPRSEDLATTSLPQIAGQPSLRSAPAHIYTSQQQSPVAFPTPSSLPSTLEYEIARTGKDFNDTYNPPLFWNQFSPDPYVYVGEDGEDDPLQTQSLETIHWPANRLDLEP